MAFNALHDHSDEEYFEFIEQLVDEAARRLAASPDATETHTAIAAYIERAYDAHLSPSEVVDFFCVSSDSVVDRLAIPEGEADALVATFDQLHDAHLARSRSLKRNLDNGTNRNSG